MNADALVFKVLAGVVAALYLGAFALSFRRSPLEKGAGGQKYVMGLIVFNFDYSTFGLLGAGFILNIGLIALKWIVADAPPLGTIYHVLTVAPLAFYPTAWLFRKRLGQFPQLAGILALSAAVPLIGTLFMHAPVTWKRMPILQSDWFIPHVLSYCVAYGLCLSAFAVLCVIVVRLLLRKETQRYEESARLLILLAFPLLTFGLCSGALWGDSAWGSYWGWDPKENWGLVTWFAYALYLHCASRPSYRKEALIAHFLAFAALAATCFMVAFTTLGEASKHAYAS